MKKIIAILSLVAIPFLIQLAAACSITKAIYKYDDNPQVTAKFMPLKHKSLTDVYFTVTSSKGQHLWFTFDWGNGFSKERLVSSKTDPANDNWKPQDPDLNKDRLLLDMDFYTFDKTLKTSLGKISASATAPDYIFIPDLAPTLWYLRDASIFSDYQLGRAMFTLSECEGV